MHSRALVCFAALALGTGSTGCLLSGNYHSAKTLEKGQSSFGTTFTATTYEIVDETDGQTTRFTLPALLPELTFHVGLQDNLEVGGRIGIAQLAMEGDVKYRFFRSDKLHLAVAPAVGIQSLVVISGLMLRLPVVATYELTDNVAVTGSLFGTSTNYSGLEGNDADGEKYSLFTGSLVGTGASVGLELSGTNFSVRPGVEFTNYVLGLDDNQFEPFTTTSIFVHLQFKFGGRNAQLDRIENKLDTMQGNPPSQPM